MATCAIKNKLEMERDRFYVPGSEIPADQETTSCQLTVTGASTLGFFCVGCCRPLHSSCGEQDEMGRGWAGQSEEEDTMRDGGVAMVMRVQHARSPRCRGPVKDGRRWGGEQECGTTCCCWTWHTEPASAAAAL